MQTLNTYVSRDGPKTTVYVVTEPANVITRHVYVRNAAGNTLISSKAEWMFNYVDNEYALVHDHTHEYDLAEDGQTLAHRGISVAAYIRDRIDVHKRKRFPKHEADGTNVPSQADVDATREMIAEAALR